MDSILQGVLLVITRAYRGGTPQQTRRGVPEAASPWPEVEGSKMCLPARFWATPLITHTAAEKVEVINLAPTPKNQQE